MSQKYQLKGHSMIVASSLYDIKKTSRCLRKKLQSKNLPHSDFALAICGQLCALQMFH